MTMTLIETKTLPSAAASIEFTSIPQTFTDLVLVASLRTERALEIDVPVLRFNSSTTNYTRRALFGDGFGSGQSATSTDNRLGITTAANAAANTFSNSTCYISNYTGSTHKSSSVDSVSEDNITFARQTIEAQLWSDTSAITSIQVIALFGPNFVVGSTISLYGITKGSDGLTVVS